MNPTRTNVLNLKDLDLFVSSTSFQKNQSIDLKFLSVFPDQNNYFYKNVLFKGSFTCSYPGHTSSKEIVKSGYVGPISSCEGLKIPTALNKIMVNKIGVLNMKLTANENDTIYYCVRAREDKKVIDDIYRLNENQSITIPQGRFFFVFSKDYSVDEKKKTNDGVYLSETKSVLIKSIQKCKIVSFHAKSKKD